MHVSLKLYNVAYGDFSDQVAVDNWIGIISSLHFAPINVLSQEGFTISVIVTGPTSMYIYFCSFSAGGQHVWMFCERTIFHMTIAHTSLLRKSEYLVLEVLRRGRDHHVRNCHQTNAFGDLFHGFIWSWVAGWMINHLYHYSLHLLLWSMEIPRPKFTRLVCTLACT